MRSNLFLGWVVILAISFSPVLLWLYLGPGFPEFTDYSSVTHSLGELAGLVAMTMFALTFILSTRISFIEDVFNGLDKVYIAHGILGSAALTLILAHPILLVLKFIPGNIRQAALYMLPSSHWSVNFGIFALLGFILLIFLTLFVKLKYNTWKFTHEFMGLMFIFAVLHTFLVRGDASSDNIFNGYYFFAAIVSIIGLFGFSYSLFLKERLFKYAVYTVSAIQKRSATMYELNLTPDHKPISYKSGQFVFLRFYNEKLGNEPHPFSIASTSDNPTLKIIIKELGDFTSRLAHLNIGDKVSVEGPYGRFNYKRLDKNQIWIAGGIGITPFLGMAEERHTNIHLKNNVHLYYSVRNEEDFIGLDELNYFASVNKKFKLISWVTEKNGHLGLDEINRISGNLSDKEYYLCGPAKFKSGIIDSLITAGVSKNNIHVEEFDFK